MKKVCFVVDTIFSLGGIQRIITDITNELVEKNLEITVLCNNTVYPIDYALYGLKPAINVNLKKVYKKKFFNRSLFKICKILNIHKKSLVCDLYLKNLLSKKEKKFLINYLNKFDYVVGVDGFNTILIGSIIDYLECKTIAWQHNSFQAYFRSKNRQLWKMDKLFEKASNKFDKVLVLTKSDKTFFDKYFNLDTYVLYNGTSIVSKKIEPDKLYGNKTILFAGRLDKYVKGLDYLTAVFEFINKKYPDWKLNICGIGEDQSYLESFIKENNLEDKIMLNGYVKNMESQYLKSSILISTSRVEGFGLGLIEAMRFGLPVVTFNNSGPNEILGKELKDLLIDNYDVLSMIEKISLLIDDFDIYESTSKECYDRSSFFTIEKMALDWLQIMNNI